jgi:hypothetical protein
VVTESSDPKATHQLTARSQIRKESRNSDVCNGSGSIGICRATDTKRYHTRLRVLTQWKNDKERNGDPDHWAKYFCPNFITEACCTRSGTMRVEWAARKQGSWLRIVTTWHIEG